MKVGEEAPGWSIPGESGAVRNARGRPGGREGSELTPASHPCAPEQPIRAGPFPFPPDFLRDGINPWILQSEGCRTSTGLGKYGRENPLRVDPGATGHPWDLRNSTTFPNSTNLTHT